MPSTNRLPIEAKRYIKAELIELRRQILRYARSISPGAERNQHQQIGMSLRRLFINRAWLDAYTVEGSQ